jgi:hypothetical protein
VRVFDLYLLDDDWALNNANWQWLSCSNFFYQVGLLFNLFVCCTVYLVLVVVSIFACIRQ